MDGFRCQVLSLSHVHFTGSVSVFFNGFFKREIRTRLAGILNEAQERQSTPQIKSISCALLSLTISMPQCVFVAHGQLNLLWFKRSSMCIGQVLFS